jgi:hypothetical protein
MPNMDPATTRTARQPGSPDLLDLSDIARWGILVTALVLGGLVLAARAADDYAYVCGLLFSGFGMLLAMRLMGRWKP